jgi:asparagine synthase (glutamine-hydrolysing)
LWWPNLLGGRVRQAWRALKEAEPNPWLTFKRQVLKPILLPGLQAFRRIRTDRKAPWAAYSAIHPAFARELGLGARMAQERHDPTFTSFPEPLQLSILRLGRRGGGGIWHELGAGLGLEVRDPTADRRVIEFCLRCPDSQYRRQGQGRMLIRRAMDGLMPPKVLYARLRGLQAADLGRRVLAERPVLDQALEGLAGHPLAASCLDLPRMARVLAELSPQTAPDGNEDCACVLLRGLGAGFFLQGY